VASSDGEPDLPGRLADSPRAASGRAVFYPTAARAANGHAAEHGYKFAPSDIGCHLDITDCGSRPARHQSARSPTLLHGAGAPKSKMQFNGVDGLPTYLGVTQGADDMSDEWISCSHWGMFPTGTKYSK
jgi:hypothetical protein